MNPYEYLLRKLRKFWPLLLLGLLFSLLESSTTAYITYLVKGIIDNIFLLKNWEKLKEITITLLIFSLLTSLFLFLNSYFFALLGENLVRDLREEVYKKILKAKYSFFLLSSSGDTVGRIVSDTNKVKEGIEQNLPTILRDPLMVLVLFGVLIYRDWLLTLILTIFLPIIAYIIRFYSKKSGKHLKTSQKNIGLISKVIYTTFYGIEYIKSFNLEEKILKNFKKFNEFVKNFALKSAVYYLINSSINTYIGYIITSFVILYGGYSIIERRLTPGDFVSYITALFLLQKPFNATQRSVFGIRQIMPTLKRVLSLREVEEEREGGITFKTLRWGIECKDLSVALGRREILYGLSLTIRKGERVALVGRSGVGKSLLAKVLCGLIDYRGSVRIDGVELKEYELSSLREKILYVPQEPFLVEGTILDNLLLAKEDATKEEIERALKLAKADFVYSLPEGLNTRVGERGMRLSGGEKQRLSLARVFLKEPEVLILDEITSALDKKVEEELLDNLFNFFKGKTFLVIAHRESNVKRCERVINLEEFIFSFP